MDGDKRMIDIDLQLESIEVARRELKKHFGKYYELGALTNSIPLLEELKELRKSKGTIPVATITFSKEELQNMVDEKMKEIELDIQAIRNKAIDEYMNLLCEHCLRQKNECNNLECPFCSDGCDIVNIAEQMKG